MVVQVNIYEAKSQLSRLIEAALAGEQVVIARAGKPLVDLVIHQGPEIIIGLDDWEGFTHDPAIFDGTDSEIDELFYGSKQ